MCKMEITDLIKGMESANVSDIYIFFTRTALWLLTPLPPIFCVTFLKWRWKVCFVVTANVTELYRDSHWNRCWNDWRNTRVWLMTIVSE